MGHCRCCCCWCSTTHRNPCGDGNLTRGIGFAKAKLHTQQPGWCWWLFYRAVPNTRVLGDLQLKFSTAQAQKGTRMIEINVMLLALCPACPYTSVHSRNSTVYSGVRTREDEDDQSGNLQFDDFGGLMALCPGGCSCWQMSALEIDATWACEMCATVRE